MEIEINEKNNCWKATTMEDLEKQIKQQDDYIAILEKEKEALLNTLLIISADYKYKKDVEKNIDI